MAVAALCLMAIIAMLSASGCSKNNGSGKTVKIESFTVAEDELILYADAVRPTPVGITLTPEDADPDNLEWTLPEDGQITLETVDGQIGLSGCDSLEVLSFISLKSGSRAMELNMPQKADNLTNITIMNVHLSGITPGEYPSLSYLGVTSCQLTGLDIRKCPERMTLGCKGNPGKDGKFIVRAMFDNSSIPEGFKVNPDSWTMEDGSEVKVEFVK